eukprot:TRINITY_DN899_c0_g1_i1.p2 TRINITY_DN899_c0_g1~~TRINITY_DN899_c0_g1_i1.p2  ORF type:complete len:120 (-),score=18.26 TRINITY_DN899_c0_g1_i1:141-500(-)
MRSSSIEKKKKTPAAAWKEQNCFPATNNIAKGAGTAYRIEETSDDGDLADPGSARDEKGQANSESSVVPDDERDREVADRGQKPMYGIQQSSQSNMDGTERERRERLCVCVLSLVFLVR